MYFLFQIIYTPFFSDNGNELESLFLQLLTYVRGEIFSEIKFSQSQLNKLAFQSGVAFAKLDREFLVSIAYTGNHLVQKAHVSTIAF